MAGHSVTRATAPTASRNRMKMPTRKPAAEASRCTSSCCSSLSMSEQDENNHGHNKHEHDEDGRDCHVIGFIV